MKKKYLVAVAVLIPAAVVMLSGCAFPGKVTGGGWIPSTSGAPGDKANFGYNAAQCLLPGPVAGHFNYHDKNAPGFAPGGVKMSGRIVNVELCGPGPGGLPGCNCPDGSYEVTVAYRSTNPNFPGEGTAGACVSDFGEGQASPPDFASVTVFTGPYTGYTNSGIVKGNIQAHACTCTDGLDNNGNGLIDAADASCTDPATGLYDPNGDEE